MSGPTIAADPQPAQPKLLDQVQARLRACHIAPSAEVAYLQWIRRFILFHNKRHPRELGQAEVTEFLKHLADKERACAAARSQARAAISFLYREVLHLRLGSASVRQRSPEPARTGQPGCGDAPETSFTTPAARFNSSSGNSTSTMSAASLPTSSFRERSAPRPKTRHSVPCCFSTVRCCKSNSRASTPCALSVRTACRWSCLRLKSA